MELQYTIDQSADDRLTFYLRSNVTPYIQDAWSVSALLMEDHTLTREQRIARLDDWLENKAAMMLHSHDIGRWLAHEDRRYDALIYYGDVIALNRIRVRFISAADAALFKLTFL